MPDADGQHDGAAGAVALEAPADLAGAARAGARAEALLAARRLALGVDPRRVLRRAVHGHPRPEHRQRRAALDPDGAQLLLARAAVGRRRLRDHLRRIPDARRPRRRPFGPPPRLRRLAAAVRARVAGGRPRARPRSADRGPGDPGPRRRLHGRILARDRHLVLRAGPEAAPRDRDLGGDERAGRRRGGALRGDHHPGDQLALDPPDQPADRRRDRRDRLCGRQGPPQRRGGQELRRRRGADADARPGRAGLRRGRGRPRRLELGRRARADPRRPRAARRVQRDRGALRLLAADPLPEADPGAERRQRRRRALQRRALPDVVRQLALPAAGARALAAAHGPDVPADGAGDHDRRVARRQAGEPLRRARRARRRAADDDRRHAAVLADRVQRQLDHLRDDPRDAHGGGHRALDRLLDDRRHAGRGAGADRPRLGAREHLAPGRRRHRPRRPDHARHPAHQSSDRHRPAGARGADPGLPPRVPDRRRPHRGGRARRLRAGAPRRPGARPAAAPDGARDRHPGRDRRLRGGRLLDRRDPRRADRRLHDTRGLRVRLRAGAAPAEAASRRSRPASASSPPATSSPPTSTTSTIPRSSGRAAR